MKRKCLLILLLACAAAVILPSCAQREEADQTVKYIVTFSDGDETIARELVSAGASVTHVPDTGKHWLDDTGSLVDPLTVAVTEDTEFRTWQLPATETRVGTLMQAEGSRFFPDKTVTRAEAAELICAMLPQNAADGLYVPSFPDISGSEHRGAIETVAAAGLMCGYPDGQFRPEAEITRAEFTAALCRMTDLEPARQASGFSDVPETHWGSGLIAAAREAGWISGCGDANFYPDAALSRAAAAAMAVRARGRQIEREEIDDAVLRTPFVDVLPTNWAYYEIIEAAYRNELIDYIVGQAETAQPGFLILDDELCHVNADTLKLDRYDEGFWFIDEGLYRVSTAGYFIDRFSAGLKELDGGMYYVAEDDGPFLTDGSFGYLDFGADGRYTSGRESVDRYVDELMADLIADDSLTRDEKLYRAYCIIRDGGYYYRGRNDTGWARGTTNWAWFCAEHMYAEKYGTCYYWAASFLFLAKRLGYQAYPVCGGVGTQNSLHAWVVIEWDDGEDYIFDVELEWAYIHHFYDVEYFTTNMYKQPRNMTNVIYVFPGENPRYYGVQEEEDDEDILDVPEDEFPPIDTELPAETEDPDAPPGSMEDPDAPPNEAGEPTDSPDVPQGEPDTPADDPADNPADNPPAEEPPTDNPPADDPPADNPPTDDQPADNPPAESPADTEPGGE